jgi:hypothetical protein
MSAGGRGRGVGTQGAGAAVLLKFYTNKDKTKNPKKNQKTITFLGAPVESFWKKLNHFSPKRVLWGIQEGIFP